MDAAECDKSMTSLILNEAFLDGLLECPVCLEKLESSSKVLPCQHTFCKKCLHEILNIHKNLRCPVCRASVRLTNIEELPCNVLLVRLLEAIKNSGQPKKDFDLCENDFNKDGHQHKMEKLGVGLDDDSGTGDQEQTNLQEPRLLSIQRCIEYLVHACRCRDPNCRLPSCQRMKRVVQHAKSCKQKTNGGCPICKQLIALCCYHAKHCQEAKCPVPFCVNIKNKLRQQKMQQARGARARSSSSAAPGKV